MKASTVFVLLAVVGCAFAELDRFNARVVPSGTLITRSDKGLAFTYPNGSVELVSEGSSAGRNVGDPDGWRTSAWAWGSSFNMFTATWEVPAAPSVTDGQCLFYFNSFQHESTNVDILQPVMQYNCNGHPGWTIASWYGSVAYVQSPSVPVKTGESITGLMEVRDNAWYIEAYSNGNLLTRLSISNSKGNSTYYQPMNSAQVALEVYGVKQCSYYPTTDSLAWTKMSITDGGKPFTPTWGPSNNPTSCSAVTKCPSPSDCVTSWTH